tara:strand:+ start:902 stop:1081 length:180 start_codon:yes stop_codon:yes gene_type:complete
MNNSIKETDKEKIAKLKKIIEELKKEVFKLKNSERNKDPSILNDQFSEEINLEKLKENK